MDPQRAADEASRVAKEGVLRGLNERGADPGQYAEVLERLARGLRTDQER